MGKGKQCHVKSVYHESRKRELQIRLLNEGRCDERLKVIVEESTCLTQNSHGVCLFPAEFLFPLAKAKGNKKCHTKTIRGGKSRSN